MDDLLKKLNVLLRASVRGALDQAFSPSSREATGDSANDLPLLKRRVEESLAFGESLRQRAAAAEAEVRQWAQRAEQALQAGDEDAARRAEALRLLAEGHLQKTQSDLQLHESTADQLRVSVEALERAVTGGESSTEQPAQADLLDEIRETVSRLAQFTTGTGKPDSAPDAPADETPSADDESALEARRRRLSQKPSSTSNP